MSHFTGVRTTLRGARTLCIRRVHALAVS